MSRPRIRNHLEVIHDKLVILKYLESTNAKFKMKMNCAQGFLEYSKWSVPTFGTY